MSADNQTSSIQRFELQKQLESIEAECHGAQAQIDLADADLR